MATPLSALGRITQPYTINGITHKARVYVRNPQLVGSVWMINSRTTDANDVVWTDAALAWAQSIGSVTPTAGTFGTALLETRSGSVWTTVDTYTPTVTTQTGSTNVAGQITLVLRDVLFHKVKVVVMEGNETYPQHLVSPTGGDSTFDGFINEYLPTFAGTTPLYKWLVGRGNQYLSTAPFVGATVTLNRKIRRRRGLT